MSAMALLPHEQLSGSPVRSPVERSCWGQPRIRTDWEEVYAGEDPLCGRVTSQEAQWAVVVTMGIAAMRERFMSSKELLWYLLSFYCFWGVVSASINYSSRFNDDDAFHKIFWGCFLVGMALQVAYLNHEMSGFATATAGLYFLIGLAHVRVGYFLRRARAICVLFAVETFLAGGLFLFIAYISRGKDGVPIVEQPLEASLLALHVILEPTAVVCFMALNRKNHANRESWDVPFSIDYIEARFESLHMMVMVCSFLFPIGLSGKFFISCTWSAAAVVCANLYALVLKLAVFDLHDIHNLHDGRQRHAIRRSRRTTMLYIYSFPWGMLGIALTGVGFVAAVEQTGGDRFTRTLLSVGPSLTWCTLGLTKALHKPLEPLVHWGKVVVLGTSGLCSLLPWALELSLGFTLCWAMSIATLALISQLLLEKGFLGHLPKGWSWHQPRLLKDWTNLREVIGPCLTSHEHFFTIMLAVAIFQLNENLRQNKQLLPWLLMFFGFYLIFSASMLYAARFNDNDAAHKLIWSIYQFQLFLMLEALSADANKVLLAWSAAAMFLLLSVGFFGRAASIARARCWMGSFAVLYLVCVAVILGFYSLRPSNAEALLLLMIVLVMVFDPFLFVLAKLFKAKHAWAVPMNVEYMISRLDGLILEVLGVAMIVPCAFYPQQFRHPYLVFCSVPLTASLAVLLKIAVLDVEPSVASRHAMRRSNWTAHLFYFLHPFVLLSLCGLGAAMPLLIEGLGLDGLESQSAWAQQLATASASGTWLALAATKLLHEPMRSRPLHLLKVLVKLLASGVLLLPLFCAMRDVVFLSFLGGTTVAVTLALMLLSLQKPPLEELQVAENLR